MKLLLFLIASLFIFNINLYAGDIDSLEKIIKKLAFQDHRFVRVLRDLNDLKQGNYEMPYNDMMDDIGQNFANIANDSSADRNLIIMGINIFSRYSSIARSRGTRYTPHYDRVLDNYNSPKFFQKAENTIQNAKEQMYEEIMDYDIKAGIDLFKIDILEGLNVSAAYKYKLNSDYKKGLHTRVDEWNLRTGINAGTIIKNSLGSTLPIYFNLTPQRKIIFARHFKTKGEALKALPKTPLAIPLNIEKVKKMEVGDYVSIPATMGLNAGVSLGWSQGVFSAGASGGVLMTGEFRINIYKTDKDHVRLKISGLRSQGENGGMHVNYGINFFGYDPVVGMINIDSQVEHFLGTNLFRINVSHIKGQQLTVDYVFDLNNKEACKAYNAILKTTLKFKATEVGKEFLKENNLDKIVFGDLVPAEKLFQADKGFDFSKCRVDRLFMGSRYYVSDSHSYQIGMKLIGASGSTSYVRNRVRKINANGSQDCYIYPVFTKKSGFSILFGLWKETNTNIVFTFQHSSPSWDPDFFYNLSFIYNSYDKRCRKGELKDFLKDTKNMLGSDISSSINLNSYNDIKFTKDFSSNAKVVFKHDSIAKMLTVANSDKYIYSAIIPIIKDYDYYADYSDDYDDDYEDHDIWIKKDWSDYKKAAARLCNKNWDGEYYWEYVLELVKTMNSCYGHDVYFTVDKLRKLYVKDSFYREIMPRFLIELTRYTSGLRNVYVTLNFGGKDIQRYNRTYGSSEFEDIFHNINEIIYQTEYNSDIIPR